MVNLQLAYSHLSSYRKLANLIANLYLQKKKFDLPMYLGTNHNVKCHFFNGQILDLMLLRLKLPFVIISLPVSGLRIKVLLRSSTRPSPCWLDHKEVVRVHTHKHGKPTRQSGSVTSLGKISLTRPYHLLPPQHPHPKKVRKVKSQSDVNK